MSPTKTKLPTVNIHGKQYVEVKDRIVFFNEAYPSGCIQTELISEPTAQRITMRAIVTPNIDKPERKFIDYASEVIGSTNINKTSALENCSTSAVGRALAYMGIGVIDGIASVDEINKAENARKRPIDPEPKEDLPVRQIEHKALTKEHILALKELAKGKGAKSMDEVKEILNTITTSADFTKVPDVEFTRIRKALLETQINSEEPF